MLIDTAQARDRLKEAGADDRLASAIIDLWRMSDEAVATKADVAELRTVTEREIAELRTTVQHEIAELRTVTEREIALLDKKIELVRAELSSEIRQVQLETTRSVRAWVAGTGGVIALLMALFEFIA